MMVAPFLERRTIFLFPELCSRLFRDHQFILPPLREHKQDILPLVHFYLKRYNGELNKQVTRISADALGMLMKYDWPGNLTELSNVIQRAVMVASGTKILAGADFPRPAADGRKNFL